MSNLIDNIYDLQLKQIYNAIQPHQLLGRWKLYLLHRDGVFDEASEINPLPMRNLERTTV